MSFSVLMATYKGEQPDCLRRCLESLQAQSLQAGEIVLVKDGPLTDALDGTIEKFPNLPIRTIQYTGDGRLGGALALGVQNCSFDTVARMDSDDIARPDRFEKQLAAFQSRDAAVLGGQIEEFNSEPGDLSVCRRVPKSICATDIWRRNPLNHMAVMFSREAVLQAGNYQPLVGFEDWYLWLRLFKRGQKLCNLDDILVDARVGNDFVGRRSGPKYAVNELKAIIGFYKQGLIGISGLTSALFIRFPVRLLPNWVTKFVYLRVLRKK